MHATFQNKEEKFKLIFHIILPQCLYYSFYFLHRKFCAEKLLMKMNLEIRKSEIAKI